MTRRSSSGISVLAVLLAALVAACSSQPDPVPEVPESDATAPAPATSQTSDLLPAVNAVPESGLGPQNLESGQCGLFIWNKTAPDQFIFFARSQTGQATFKVGGETVTGTQIINRGSIFGEFMTEQGYTAPDGAQVVLNVRPGQVLQGGQRIEGGRMTITTTEGWRTVIPVLGVRACQP
ncbi:hypothetical protein [Henriciella sp.]|uniref:hypothetical protein n=1 Tax=Henriciella sp. TaxID=1968823 RepID=UPI00261941D2|nr:hypothetical protein [Henriciella sp.]